MHLNGLTRTSVFDVAGRTPHSHPPGQRDEGTQTVTPLASRLVTTLVVAGLRTRWSEAENEAEAAVDVVHQVAG